MPHFLIVDDDVDASQILAIFFERFGHQATVAPNGREALTVVLNNTPDAVLLDVVMPVMDGLSFLEVIRSYVRIHGLPVVVLTGLAESPMIDRVQSLNVNAVMVKAKATPEEILKTLEESVSHYPG